MRYLSGHCHLPNEFFLLRVQIKVSELSCLKKGELYAHAMEYLLCGLICAIQCLEN